VQGAQLRKHIDATLGSGNLWEAVRLPPGEDFNEWLAVNSNISSLLIYVDLHYFDPVFSIHFLGAFVMKNHNNVTITSFVC